MQEDEAIENGPLRPQYTGDDSRPTDKKEFAGWYSYGWAAEVFTVCAMGMRPFSPHLCLVVLDLSDLYRFFPPDYIRTNGSRPWRFAVRQNHSM